MRLENVWEQVLKFYSKMVIIMSKLGRRKRKFIKCLSDKEFLPRDALKPYIDEMKTKTNIKVEIV